MEIFLNGQVKALAGEITVLELLQQLNIKGESVAVEYNRQILPRNQFEQVILKNGDILEIVRFVGGGMH